MTSVLGPCICKLYYLPTRSLVLDTESRGLCGSDTLSDPSSDRGEAGIETTQKPNRGTNQCLISCKDDPTPCPICVPCSFYMCSFCQVCRLLNDYREPPLFLPLNLLIHFDFSIRQCLFLLALSCTALPYHLVSLWKKHLDVC